eukprot:105924-Rhodomonas_salina.1
MTRQQTSAKAQIGPKRSLSRKSLDMCTPQKHTQHIHIAQKKKNATHKHAWDGMHTKPASMT